MISYVYGKNVGLAVIEDHRTIHKVYLSSEVYSGQWKTLLERHKLDYEIVDKRQLDKLSDNGNHQGIVLAIEEYQTYGLAELLVVLPKDELSLLVLLDGIEDPHNLGAILRNCDGAGAQGVIIAKHRRAPLNATVAKVSSGAIANVKVAEVSNLTQAIKQLKKAGYWIVGCDAGGEDIYQQKFDMPIVLVIGAEGKGISRLVKENCDYLFSLPMRGKLTSLNASVASGIAMYQIQHQRSLCQTRNGDYVQNGK